MKNRSVALAVFLVAGIGMGTYVTGKIFNPFSKSDWEDVGETIKGGFEKGVKFMGKTFKRAVDLVDDAFKRVKECVAVAGLGTQWAAKKAAYETAKASLKAANTLQVLDPRLTSLEVARQTAQASVEIAKKSLDAAQLGAKAFSKVLEGISVASGKGINIKNMSFEAYMSKLIKEAKGPRVTIDAVILGQHIKETLEIDFGKPLDAAKKIMKTVFKKLKEFKDIF